MKNYIVIASLLVLAGCGCTEPQRAAGTAFKGMELYSWKPTGCDWHFSLLVGTNIEKPVSVITAPETAVVGVAGLKQKLSQLPKGEQVFWRNMANEPVSDSVIRDLATFCRKRDITLMGP